MGQEQWEFLVTAGGTSEKIDEVRCITNSATGRLGSLIAQQLAEDPRTERVFYICGKTAFRPETPKAEILSVSDVADLEQTVRRVLAAQQIHAVIHSMAVSDYRVKTITTRRLWESGSQTGLDQEGKLPSGEEELVLVLQPTVKIISLFRDLAPDALLVGFKLLDGASRDELCEAAFGLLRKNRCTWVFANDGREITEGKHRGFLVDRDKNIEEYKDKASIAGAVARHVLDKLKKEV